MKNDDFEMFCPQYLTNKFSKTKTPPYKTHLGIVILNIFALFLDAIYIFNDPKLVELYFGYFWHSLATFGIENGSMITLPTFGVFEFAIIMYDVWEDIIKLKITWPLGSFFTF